MKTLFIFIFALLVGFSHTANAQETSPKEELNQLLQDFLKGASENDAEMHDRFWAEDLIYTSSSGERFGKAEIMAGFNEVQEQDNEAAATTYSAEDIQIHVYDNTAVLAFRLVGKTNTDKGIQTDQYLNSGTFLKRNGMWKVVNWQATKVPE